jgi:hypothetical protein
MALNFISHIMAISDQILQKINTSPEVSCHTIVKKDHLLIVRGAGYEVRIKVINEMEVIISKTWKLGIFGVLFSKQKALRMEMLIESIDAILQKDGITIHSVMMV